MTRRQDRWNEEYLYFQDDFDPYEEEFLMKPAIPVSHNMDAPLYYINYTNKRLQPGAEYVIFGVKKKDLEWDRTKAKKANQVAQASRAKVNTPRYFQEFLRSFYDKPNLEIICIMGGYNAATLYNFYVYGFKSEGAR
jgi:hypothetical protein